MARLRRIKVYRRHERRAKAQAHEVAQRVDGWGVHLVCLDWGPETGRWYAGSSLMHARNRFRTKHLHDEQERYRALKAGEMPRPLLVRIGQLPGRLPR